VKGDLLAEATRALRDSSDGAFEGARATEERILAALPRRRRLRLVKPWGLSLAAVLIGSSVWAMSGTPVRMWIQSLAQVGPPPPAGHTGPVAERRRARASTPPEAAPPPVQPPEAPLPATPDAPPRAPTIARPVVRSTSPPDGPAPLAPEAVTPEPEPAPALAAAPAPAAMPAPAPPAPAKAEPAAEAALDVYETAHDLHFKQRDYARALRAWDRYLELAPRGSLALEARFHRGVCLARLGRMAEARQALEPFARGDYGTYRQAQAQKLLDASQP